MFKFLKRPLQRALAFGMAAACVLGAAMPAQAAGGGTGKITISGSTSEKPLGVAGKTFKAYQILSAELAGDTVDDGVIYKVPDTLKPYFVGRYADIDGNEKNFDQLVQEKILAEGFVNPDAETKVTDTDAMQELGKDILAKVSADTLAGVLKGTVTAGAGDTSVEIADLPFGYYLIVDDGAKTPVSALALTTVASDIEVHLKGSVPELTKQIDDGGTLKDYVNQAVGNTVNFQVDTKVPDMTGYRKYAFAISDVMSNGLTLKQDAGLDAAFAITMAEPTPGTGTKTLAAGTDYKVVAFDDAAGQGYRIVFKDFIQYKGNDSDLGNKPSYEGWNITVKYAAEVSDDAVIGAAGNPNTAKLIYSNNPQQTDFGDPTDPDDPEDPGYTGPKGETTPDTVRVYVTGLQVLKVTKDGSPLEGAQFTLKGTALNRVKRTGSEFVEAADGTYWALRDGSFTTTDPSSGNIDTGSYADTKKKYKKQAVDAYEDTTSQVTRTVVSNADGVIQLAGLMAGDYTLTEVAAPDGYNLLKGDIEIHIGYADPSGDGVTDCTWTGTYKTPDMETAAGMEFSPEGASGLFSFEVENLSGQELPSTGGMGTTLFYVIGGALVILAGVVLVVRKRSK